MSLNNKIVLIIACLSHYFLGSLISTTGIFVPYVEQDYQLGLSGIGNIFTFFNIGLFLSIAFTGHLTQLFSIKKLMDLACFMSIAAILSLNLHHTIVSYIIVIFVLGLSSGALISTTSYLVIHANKNKQRGTANLLLTDFCFSFSGILLPICFASLLTWHIAWFKLYNIILIPCFVMLYFFRYYETNTSTDDKEIPINNTLQWNSLPLNLIALASFFFILSELVLTMWLVKYLTSKWHVSMFYASSCLTGYWLTRALGLLINQFTVLKFGIEKYLYVSISLGLVVVGMMMQSYYSTTFIACLLILGFINSGIYSSLLGYACLHIDNPSPKTVSYIYASGTLGTLLSAWLSGMVTQHMGLVGAIRLVAFSYFMCFIIMNVLSLMNKRDYRYSSSIKGY